MAKLNGVGLRRRMARQVFGDLGDLEDLEGRIAELEAEIQESRQLNLRVAELVDLVQELLLPVASQDRAKIEAALVKFERSQ